MTRQKPAPFVRANVARNVTQRYGNSREFKLGSTTRRLKPKELEAIHAARQSGVPDGHVEHYLSIGTTPTSPRFAQYVQHAINHPELNAMQVVAAVHGSGGRK